MQDVLVNDQDPFRLSSLLEGDEGPPGDLWNGMELGDTCRPSRGPTPAINVSSMSVPVTIAGGRRGNTGAAANDSAESTDTMLGLSYEEPTGLVDHPAHDLTGAWSAPAAWNSYVGAWNAPTQMVPQHEPEAAGAAAHWPDVSGASASVPPYVQHYQMQVMASMSVGQQPAAYAPVASPHAGGCAFCPGCSMRFAAGSAPATDGSAWAAGASGYNWAPAAADGRAGHGAWPYSALGSGMHTLAGPHAAAATMEGKVKDIPASEGSTMQGGRSRTSYSTVTEQDSVHDDDDEFERTGSLEILSFDASDDEVLRLESGPLELGEAGGAAAAARSSTPIPGTPSSGSLLVDTPAALLSARAQAAAARAGAPRARGGSGSPLLPPAQPAPRGVLFTQHHTASGRYGGGGGTGSPAGAPRGLAARPTAALKRSGSARRVSSTLDLDALTLAGGEGSFSTGSAAASAAAGAFALADPGSAACLAGTPGSPRGSSGRPVRQAARRSMAFAAAAAAAEAWDDEAYGGGPVDGGLRGGRGGQAGAAVSSAGAARSSMAAGAAWYGHHPGMHHEMHDMHDGTSLVHDEGSVHGGGLLGSAGGLLAGTGPSPTVALPAPMPEAATASGREKKKHNPWTTEETRALVAGVRLVGVGRWAEIKRAGGATVAGLLAARSAVDLKDKWRNLARVARLPRAALRQRLAKGSEVPMDVVLEVQELLELARTDRTAE